MTGTFAEWTERVEAYAAFVKSLADYKLKAAQAELELAKAGELRQLMAARQLIIRALLRSLQQAAVLERSVARQLADVARRQRHFERFLDGRYLEGSTYYRARNAFRWFATQALLHSDAELFVVAVPDAARRGAQFVNCRNRDAACEDVRSDIDNALQLMEWLFQQRCLPRLGSPAQQTVVSLIRAINQPVREEAERLREYVREMKAGTYDAWRPLSILGVEKNSLTRKIEETGVRPTPRSAKK